MRALKPWVPLLGQIAPGLPRRPRSLDRRSSAAYELGALDHD